ncbi:hypothetical protein [Polluticaenibacter yanchengensis]|uniref:Outer membrane protein beta-barrel domain-containing protein n=1 Tax=Polluticaenibacter yanchengensis TaxID=3014562 RepID=A0ABT4UIW6_9BACT|nr:hypothetical protein [Chitinophagaceae bacterium LY-5]
MKKGLTFLTLLLATSVATVKAQVVEKGTNMINAGIGIGGNYGGWSNTSSIPQISASFERGMWEIGGPGVITLGGYIGHKGYKIKDSDYKWSWTTIGARAAYHFNGFDIEKLDVYGGTMLGYNIYSSSYDTYGGSGLSLSGFIGGRWMFANNIGVYAEIGGGGYNFSVLNAGVTFKF